ncbi:MAG TPA: hypothetical protein VMM37_09865 [Bacteroidota bacterium]|nr:hypothetical protein [Bacteroidota bacterium]
MSRVTIILFLILTLSGCDAFTGEPFDNPADPLGDSYKPSAPDLYGYLVGVRSVQIAMTNHALLAEAYELQRRAVNVDDYVRIAVVSIGASAYVDTLVTPGYEYAYRARAFKGSKFGNWSPEFLVYVR